MAQKSVKRCHFQLAVSGPAGNFEMIFVPLYFFRLAASAGRLGILPIADADHSPPPLVHCLWHNAVPPPGDGHAQAGRLKRGEGDQHLTEPELAHLAEPPQVEEKLDGARWPCR